MLTLSFGYAGIQKPINVTSLRRISSPRYAVNASKIVGRRSANCLARFHVIAAESDLISPSGLGAIERLVRKLNDLVQSGRRSLHGGDTYADGARNRLIVIFGGGLLDGAAYPLSHN